VILVVSWLLQDIVLELGDNFLLKDKKAWCREDVARCALVSSRERSIVMIGA
jgi:hypothetical protein